MSLHSRSLKKLDLFHILSFSHHLIVLGLSGWVSGKEFACNARDVGDRSSVPELGKSPGEGNGNPLQYPCLEISWTEEPGRGSHGVAKSWTRLND